MNDDPITVEVFQEVDALLAEIEREREQGPPFTGGIVPPCPDKLAHLIVDGVISRRLAEPIVVETRWVPLSYDEVRENNRALARRDRDRGPAFDGGCVVHSGGTPFVLEAGERVLTRADRLETVSKITSEKGE